MELDPIYIKAYHRRGKAQMELKNYIEAVKDFQKILSLEPENKEVNGELKEARKFLSQSDLDNLAKNQEKPSNFKKIEIQEEEEEEVDDTSSKILKELEERKQKANEMTKKGNFPQAIPYYETDLQLIEKLDKITPEILNFKANLLNNISFCYAQMGEAAKAVAYATDVIKMENVDIDQRIKALLRRGISYIISRLLISFIKSIKL